MNVTLPLHPLLYLVLHLNNDLIQEMAFLLLKYLFSAMLVFADLQDGSDSMWLIITVRSRLSNKFHLVQRVQTCAAKADNGIS